MNCCTLGNGSALQDILPEHAQRLHLRHLTACINRPDDHAILPLHPLYCSTAVHDNLQEYHLPRRQYQQRSAQPSADLAGAASPA